MTEEVKVVSSEVVKIKPLTNRQRAQAVALYQAGDMNCDDLARKFGKSKRTFERLFKSLGVKQGEKRKEVEEKIKSELEKTMAEDSVVLLQRIKKTKDDHYKMSEGIAALIWNEIVTMKTEKKPPAVIDGNVKALKNAAAALAIIREERFMVLGLLNDEPPGDKELPELVVKEMTAEQAAELSRRQESTDLTIPDLDMAIPTVEEAEAAADEAEDDLEEGVEEGDIETE